MPKQELTVVLDGRANILSPESVITVISSLAALLKSIDTHLWQVNAPRYQWSISGATMNSPLEITLTAIRMGDLPDADVVGGLINGFKILEAKKNVVPPYFCEDDLIAAKKLVSVYDDGIASITLRTTKKKSIQPTRRIADKVDVLTRSAPVATQDAYGSIEGKLRRVTVDDREDHELSEIQIIDRMTESVVECKLDAGLAEELSPYVRKRVVLYGKIHYENLVPKKIRVEGFDAISPTPPTLEQIHKMGFSITGGKDAREFIEELRGQ